MEPEQERLLRETYRLALENNKLLRSMRRQAWMGRIMTILIYAAIIGVPIWFYMTYISDKVDAALQTVGLMQQKGQQAQGQFQNIAETVKQFQERMIGGSSTPTQQ